MRFSKKNFMTSGRKCEGFTLVELVVVIAILGILSGVGTVGYSGYVKKANMAADEQLMSSIRNAVTLAMYETGNDFDGGAVKVTQVGTSVVEATDTDKALLEKAMERAFGEGWKTSCKLSYAGWEKESGNAANIIGTNVDKYMDDIFKSASDLAGDMEHFMAIRDLNNLPVEIRNIIGKDTATTTEMTNAAMLSVAKTISGAGDQQRMITAGLLAACNGVIGNGGTYEFAPGATGGLFGVYEGLYGGDDADIRMVQLATSASMYTFIEAYSQYAKHEGGDTYAEERLNAIEYEGKSAAQVYGEIQQAMADVIGDAKKKASEGKTYAANYLTVDMTDPTNPKGPAVSDANAFVAAMSAMGQSSDTLGEKLNQRVFEDGTAAKLAKGYLSAGAVVTENGQAAVIVNSDKSVVVYLGGIRD